MTTTTDPTFTISVSAYRRGDFDIAIDILRAAGATYDASSKTWALTVDDRYTGDMVAYLRDHRGRSSRNAWAYVKFMTIEEA